MITHENLVEAVQQCREWWSCPAPSDSEPCPVLKPCKDCAEKLVTEYETSLRADERMKVLDEVISVLVDLGYGDEENGAEWAYMVALYDVARRIKQLKGEQT